jgi:hypothetical protein
MLLEGRSDVFDGAVAALASELLGKTTGSVASWKASRAVALDRERRSPGPFLCVRSVTVRSHLQAPNGTALCSGVTCLVAARPGTREGLEGLEPTRAVAYRRTASSISDSRCGVVPALSSETPKHGRGRPAQGAQEPSCCSAATQFSFQHRHGGTSPSSIAEPVIALTAPLHSSGHARATNA